MSLILKIIWESTILAFGQLSGNKLRSFLSLLGITIGIFCIISVFSGVDSLEDNVRGSFEKLGNDVIFVEKFSWSDSFEKWWKYIKRPNPSFEDYLLIKKKAKSAQLSTFYLAVGFTTLKYKSNSAQNVVILGTTSDFIEIFKTEIDQGRNMTLMRSTIGVKAKEGLSTEDLKDEVTGILRSSHRLSPREDDDFSLNEMSMLTSILDVIFLALNAVGFIIGIFAIIVGMFSVANIMFVSVKERTPLIGVKKALGAKHFVILLEFLIESVVLCILGGILGLGLVYFITFLITNVAGFPIFLSSKNIIIGLSLSLIVGIVSGIIPAYLASRMNPVEAIRA